MKSKITFAVVILITLVLLIIGLHNQHQRTVKAQRVAAVKHVVVVTPRHITSRTPSANIQPQTESSTIIYFTCTNNYSDNSHDIYFTDQISFNQQIKTTANAALQQQTADQNKCAL